MQSTSMIPRKTNLVITVFIMGLIWFADADAAIYKWKDENGKVHFTDNPTKVPKAFRKKPIIKDRKTPAIRKKKPLRAQGRLKNKVPEPGKKKDVKPKGLTEGERAIAEAAVKFMEADIPRYEKFYVSPANKSKLWALQKAVGAAAAQKKALLDQISNAELPLFKEIAEFLKSSIAADEKTQKIMPKKFNVLGQTQLVMNRLKNEAEQETQFLKKLTTALNTKAEKGETGSKLPSPAKAIKKPTAPPSKPETPPEKSAKKPGVPGTGAVAEKSEKKEKESFEDQIEAIKKRLQSLENKRARQLKKLEELNNLSYKPKSWTTEESLEEVIEKQEEAVNKTNQEILKYKEKLKAFSVQD
jgi:hypothetical protein